MYRGTTPTNIFSTNVDLRNYRVYVTYVQNGEIVLEKTNEDITITEEAVEIRLSQEETLKLQPSREVKIQIRYVAPDGTAGASNVMAATVSDILKDGEIEYEADGNIP